MDFMHFRNIHVHVENVLYQHLRGYIKLISRVKRTGEQNIIVHILVGEKLGGIMVVNTEISQNIDQAICKRCHRKLKDIESRKRGFGSICYEKYLKNKQTYLFEVNDNEIIIKG